MPKLNVYVSDALATRIREAVISVSGVCQRALEEEVRRVETRRVAQPAVLQMAERFRAARTDVRPDDLVRESEGYRAGATWAANVASSHELAELAGVGDEVPVSREQGSLYEALAAAGLSTDSETNRVLSTNDPWSRGFLRACRELWQQVQPLM